VLISFSTIRLLFLLENYNFEAHYLVESLDPLQGPTHSLTLLLILTQRSQNVCLDVCGIIQSPGCRPKLTVLLRIWLLLDFAKGRPTFQNLAQV